MKRVLGGFGAVSGATYPLRALVLLRRSPQLWSYTIAPVTLNIAIGSILYIGLWPYAQRLLQAITSETGAVVARLPAWLDFLGNVTAALGWVFQLIAAIGLSLLVGLILVQFGTLLGAPFYGKLSERVEKIRTGTLVAIEVGLARDLGRAILFELKKLVLALPIGLILLSLNFVPGPGTVIASLGGMALSALLVGLDFFDGALERRRLRFRQKLAIFMRALPASGTFSLVCLVLVGLPILNFLTIPLCVTAGTLFACDRILPRLDSSPDDSLERS